MDIGTNRGLSRPTALAREPQVGSGMPYVRRSGAIAPDVIERSIYSIRGHNVMLDVDLAALYKVKTKALVQAVKRNARPFPPDFTFRLDIGEARALRSHSVTSNGRGGRRYPPYAFTEHGVAMLSSVLRSQRAVDVNISIMRTFVRLRDILNTHKNLAAKLAALERKYDDRFRVVFEAIRELMKPASVSAQRQIGFRAGPRVTAAPRATSTGSRSTHGRTR
jgi:hypothetical protein